MLSEKWDECSAANDRNQLHGEWIYGMDASVSQHPIKPRRKRWKWKEGEREKERKRNRERERERERASVLAHESEPWYFRSHPVASDLLPATGAHKRLCWGSLSLYLSLSFFLSISLPFLHHPKYKHKYIYIYIRISIYLSIYLSKCSVEIYIMSATLFITCHRQKLRNGRTKKEKWK